MRKLLQLAAVIFMIAGPAAFMQGCSKEKPACPLGQKRIGGVCKCSSDAQCPRGKVCRSGSCVPKPKTCPEVPCTGGKVCKSGRCVACTSDDECGSGRWCDNGTCRAEGTECGPDHDCPIGQECRHGYCVKAKDPAPVCETADCKVPCKLHPIYFGYKEAQLTPKELRKLKENVACLRKALRVGVTHVHLVGMADPRGPTTYNDDLSSLRIKSVIDRLMLLDPALASKMTITTEPLGETCATGIDEQGWAKDRRVQFLWYKKPGQVCPDEPEEAP